MSVLETLNTYVTGRKTINISCRKFRKSSEDQRSKKAIVGHGKLF